MRQLLTGVAPKVDDCVIVYEPASPHPVPDAVVRNVHLLDGRHVDIGVAEGSVVAVEPVGVLAPAPIEHAGGAGLCTRPLTEPHLHLDKAGTADLLPGGARDLAEAISSMRSVKHADRGAVERVARRMARMLEVVRVGGASVARIVVDIDETWGLTSFHAALQLRASLAESIDLRVVAFPQDGLTPAVLRLLHEAVEEGADAVGAHTDLDPDARAHLREIGMVAGARDLPIEVHVDEGARPEAFFLPEVLDELDGRSVTLVHCLSLGTLPAESRGRWTAAVADQGWPVVVAPSVLALGVPIAPVAELMDAGVPVLVGSDNLQDVFCPLGTGRGVENARITAVVGQLVRNDLHSKLIAGITDSAWSVVTGDPGPIEVGTAATFVVHQAPDATALLRGDDAIRLTVRNGVAVNVNQEEACAPTAS